MSHKIINLSCLLAAMLFVPATLFATWSITGSGMADILTSSSIVIIYYIPVLALISIVRPHFTPRLAALPFLIILLLELWAFVPGHAPFDMLGRGLNGFYPNTDPAVLGKSAFLVIGAMAAALSLLHKTTLFRLICTIMAFAQCSVVVLFHLVAVIWPLHGVNNQEALLSRTAIQAHGSFEILCKLEGRSCVHGTLEQAKSWSLNELRSPAQAVSLIDDTALEARLFHSWIENPTPGAMDRVSVITAFKKTSNEISLMTSTEGPSLIYAGLRKSLGVLLAAFHTAWIALGIAILARHGTYSFQKGRWQRDT